MFLIGFTIVSLLIAGFDIMLALNAFRKHDGSGRALAMTCVFAAVVDLAYLASALSESEFIFACMSSLYFWGVTAMLFNFVIFAFYFTKRSLSRLMHYFLRIGTAYVVIEFILFAINPFFENVVGFIPRNTPFAIFDYDMHALFKMHLFVCYTFVAVVLFLFFRKIVLIPREYKRQYIYSVIGVLGIVAINAVFLYTPGLSIYNFLDYSICGYSLAAYVLYWACYNYTTRGMADLLKMSVFENFAQGLVLFDYSGKLVLNNEMAVQLLKKVEFKSSLEKAEFVKNLGINQDELDKGDAYVFQSYVKDGESSIPLRCEYKAITNAKKRVIGYLFMFANAILETDPLTGFHNWDNFKSFATDNEGKIKNDFWVAACDISQMSVLNEIQGKQQGDKKIRELSQLLRGKFPRNAYFVRGQEAMLIVIVPDFSSEAIEKIFEEIVGEFSLHIQYAINPGLASDATLDIVDAAIKGLKHKKLLDKASKHSAILTSLLRALQECDHDTEAHVERTQKLARNLGKRLQLTDVQLSDLSLLCLLHDIGKITIPLEILNKPGKLTMEELDVLRSHAEKGYQIAKSSNELSGVADLILHHHERWDGSGYPDGLSKESIPLLSRIISVVDAYDAMVSTRSYRPALSISKAVDELKRCAGSQFDPGVVAEFLQMLKEISPEETSGASSSPEVQAIVREELELEDSHVIHQVHDIEYARYIIDSDFKILSIDGAFEKLTGYTEAEVFEKSLSHIDLIPTEDREEYLALVASALSKTPEAFFEHRIVRKNGSVIYVLCYGKSFYDSAVRASRSEIVFCDATSTYAMRIMAAMERDRAKVRETHLENISRCDSLTGLLNRSAFKSDMEQRLLEGKFKVMLLMLDVDHFKEYNDTNGHHAGDEFLTFIAQTLTSALRREDIAGRLGGDEFAAALFFKKECTDEFMYRRAQEIFDKVNMTLKLSSGETSLSMGAIVANEKLNTFNMMYEAADKALYTSKENGRSRLSIAQ